MSRSKTVYLAGPMRDKPLYNFPMFFRAAMWLRDEFDFLVDNPAEKDMANEKPFDPGKPIEEQDFNLREAFKWDVHKVCDSDALVMLPGWEHSVGARTEVLVALCCQVRIYEIRTNGHDSSSSEWTLHKLEISPRDLLKLPSWVPGCDNKPSDFDQPKQGNTVSLGGHGTPTKTLRDAIKTEG